MRRYFSTDKGRRLAWYLYDFGNSAYAAVVILAIYSAYFKDGVVGGAEGSRLWGLSVAIAMFVVALISPVLGAVADRLAIKKRMLLIFTLMSVFFTGMLFFVGKGDIFTGMLFFILAEIGYRAAQVYYDSLLPEVAARKDFGRISGIGWAIGSFGGILCLGIVLPLVVLVGGNFIVRLTMVITAVYFLLATLPLFLFLEEKSEARPLQKGENLLTLGFVRLWKTIRELGHYSEYLKFMIAFILYNDGVMIALNFAAIIGAVLYGFEREQLIVLIILVQVTNLVGAWAFGILADRTSSKTSLMVSMAVMATAVVWMQTGGGSAYHYYLIGCLAGFAIAGLQSVSRSMVAKLAPAGRSAEFFGLFAVAGRSSSVIGPAVFGWVAADGAAHFMAQGLDALAAEQAGMRMAIYVILVFMALGTALLTLVREEEGAAVAEGRAGAAA
ncbi:MAG: MFS transporter [Rhizobiaceae bacterium]